MITFQVNRKKYNFRTVACRIAMCIGVTDPLAWTEDDKGPPFWLPNEQKFQLNPGNDYWLRKDKDSPCDNPRYTLTYRYEGTPHREEAFNALKTWLECDLVFGE